MQNYNLYICSQNGGQAVNDKKCGLYRSKSLTACLTFLLVLPSNSGQGKKKTLAGMVIYCVILVKGRMVGPA